MTGTDVREALRSVADATTAPGMDRLAFQRVVRRERRRRYAGRASVAVGVAAAVVAAGSLVAPLLRPGSAAPEPVGPAGPTALGLDLQQPAYASLDGRLVAIDPSGHSHDLGVGVEEVLGGTTEFVYAIGRQSQVLRFDVHGSGDSWSARPAPSGVAGPVSSAQLSADGRYLGWLDLEQHLHERDLVADSTIDPIGVGSGAYLVDVAQGSGVALVSEDRGLVRYAGTGEHVLETSTWEATSTADLLAVPGARDTRVYRYGEGGEPDRIGAVPGSGRLSPYGGWIASIVQGAADDATVRLAVPGEDSVPLDVGVRPYQLAWADDDTVLVSGTARGVPALVACSATHPETRCARIDVEAQDRVDLSR